MYIKCDEGLTNNGVRYLLTVAKCVQLATCVHVMLIGFPILLIIVTLLQGVAELYRFD